LQLEKEQAKTVVE